ncbi:MAG TPA: valine--tRNA ligase [Kofleriaceae bacterium]|nr:valine--tRNA ligase [Kofleriaceae bacterium]
MTVPPSDALPKQYDPSEVEPRWLRFWLEQGLFHADAAAPMAPYAITLPPPNVTGSLHLGHALGGTIQDILIRWRRMQGANAMWLPGIDHASIGTQMLVERDLKRREGKTRHDLGRDAFLARVWQWKEKHGGRIIEQMKLLGFSLDYERERFTMDPGASAAVREVFVRLYEEGLIYRAHRLVNWCVDCHTGVSDLEVNNVEERGSLWTLIYPVVGSDQRIEVATTRPETMLGDTGVAVHPSDERYRDLIGKKVRLPLTDREIPIVADEFVDPAFGSGAVKVTPGHDFNDYECGLRCGLEVLSIIDLDGRLIAPAPEKYRGMTVAEARRRVVADLDEAGLLGEVKDYTVPVGRCERSGTVVEPLLSNQWWVRTAPLAEPAIRAVESGKTRFVPDLWTKTYMHWMSNIKDWNISRQLWWGHRIPAWYCDGCDHITVSREDPTACPGCGGAALRQDDDVLDTWFSSGLWPFSTLGWPAATRDLKTFYPNAVLVTAPDIIFFWVARMMMMGLHFTGKVPFRVVYLTPIVVDENGDKMSKVKGNGMDPLDVVHGATLAQLIEAADGHEEAIKYLKKHRPQGLQAFGADALRFTLAVMTTPGRSVRLSTDRIETCRNFINKVWNASRFALMNLGGTEARPDTAYEPDRFADLLARAASPAAAGLALVDRWILSRLQRAAGAVDEALGEFRFGEAANAIYHFMWDELCDRYIELAKAPLQSDDERRRFLTQGTLATVLELSLRLLHPFIPFASEEIWQKLPKPSALPASLMVTLYPQSESRLVDEQAEREMSLLLDVAAAIRTLRSTYSVPPSWKVPVEVRVPDDASRALVEQHRDIVEQSARATLTLSASGGAIPQSARQVVRADIEVVVPLQGLIDIDAERARIQKEIGRVDKEIAQVDKKLSNQKFVANAPAEVVDKERARLAEEASRRQKLVSALEALA